MSPVRLPKVALLGLVAQSQREREENKQRNKQTTLRFIGSKNGVVENVPPGATEIRRISREFRPSSKREE